MVAVAAFPTPGAGGGSFFAVKPHKHPPYKNMIVSAIAALKGQKGSSRPAISKYIVQNYSGLPPSHSVLLSVHLRRLQTKGVIRMLKLSYKLADLAAAGYMGSDVGSKKRGRPLKYAHPAPDVLYNAPKRLGRPPKLEADAPPLKKRNTMELPNPNKVLAAVDPSYVYILPQAEMLNSGFLQSLPGAVAIILPPNLLSKNTGRSPILILPNGVQSLVDASAGKKKLGRPIKDLVQKKPDQPPKESEKTQPILQRRKVVVPNHVLLCKGELIGDRRNVVARKIGRPRKINDVALSENSQVKLANEGRMAIPEVVPSMIKNDTNPTMPWIFQGKQKASGVELKKKPVGRPKKVTFLVI